ncbi:MAG: LysM peptidoglycan-binding domain-containing protein [Chloroflexota bacterium]|nr:LysM peptidoglycan-binding domain-containing protein [Chloroflexota bacterium]
MVKLDRLGPPLVLALAVVACAGCILSLVPDASPASAGANPTPVPTPRLTVPAPTPEPTFLVYKIRAGDVLEKIAKRYKTTVASIGYWNRVRYKTLDPDSAEFAPDAIKVGWQLRIHPGQTTDTDYEDPTPIPPPESPDPPEDSPSASPSG